MICLPDARFLLGSSEHLVEPVQRTPPSGRHLLQAYSLLSGLFLSPLQRLTTIIQCK